VRPRNDEAGDWWGAVSPTHALHFAAMAEILRSFNANGSVLDVGCGEAALRAWLPKDAKIHRHRTIGAAVRIALKRNPSANIIQRRRALTRVAERFDSIVFNEILYYADDPIGLLRKYAVLIRKKA
jgi:2-polyprenyl-3-methyl-5-hydroxy-6-metoxy-1,4-benzoquinol methylase